MENGDQASKKAYMTWYDEMLKLRSTLVRKLIKVGWGCKLSEIYDKRESDGYEKQSKGLKLSRKQAG